VSARSWAPGPPDHSGCHVRGCRLNSGGLWQPNWVRGYQVRIRFLWSHTEVARQKRSGFVGDLGRAGRHYQGTGGRGYQVDDTQCYLRMDSMVGDRGCVRFTGWNPKIGYSMSWTFCLG
jgi:hypothetical protein